MIIEIKDLDEDKAFSSLKRIIKAYKCKKLKYKFSY